MTIGAPAGRSQGRCRERGHRDPRTWTGCGTGKLTCGQGGQLSPIDTRAAPVRCVGDQPPIHLTRTPSRQRRLRAGGAGSSSSVIPLCPFLRNPSQFLDDCFNGFRACSGLALGCVALLAFPGDGFGRSRNALSGQIAAVRGRKRVVKYDGGALLGPGHGTRGAQCHQSCPRDAVRRLSGIGRRGRLPCSRAAVSVWWDVICSFR